MIPSVLKNPMFFPNSPSVMQMGETDTEKREKKFKKKAQVIKT